MGALLAACGLLAMAPAGLAQTGALAGPERELEELARALRGPKPSAAYTRLQAFARGQEPGPLAARAALALGYQDFTARRYEAARRWLARAEKGDLLREYAVYWNAQASRAAGRHAAALERLESFRREFPESVMAVPALEAHADSALALRRAREVLAILAASAAVEQEPSLLFLRARALQALGRGQDAALDYAAVFSRFPLGEQGAAAEQRWRALAAPGLSPELLLARAEAFYEARRLREAWKEFTDALRGLTGIARARAELRIAQCRAALKKQSAPLEKLSLSDPELDAERLYALSQALRAQKKEVRMREAIEQLVARYPRSPWAEEALLAAGNYDWASLDRARAAEYYRRAFAAFPGGRYAATAQWRVAWTAYLERHPDAAALLEEHLRRFPGSPHTANALYWLGRAAERAGNAPRARGFFAKLAERFPESYFGRLANERLASLGAGPLEAADLLFLVQPPPALPATNGPIPPLGASRLERARALRGIGFDTSAELELRAAYEATRSPRLILEVARAATDSGRVMAGIAAARQAFPQLEANRLEDGREEVWRAVYPLLFGSQIEQHAAAAEVDPMLVAGLIRQESVFQPQAVSRAGAIGLMQVVPRTGRRLARRLKLRYSRARLFQPEYNLRLGSMHLAELVRALGLEGALAAYNAGEHRVEAWHAERRYEEPAEFVESIPFTETREYVQVVMRNAEIYRRLYGKEFRLRTGGSGGRP